MGGMAIFAIIVALLIPGGFAGGNIFSSGATSRINTGGPVPIEPDAGLAHVLPGEPHENYRTLPATSGPHWFVPPSIELPTGSPARWGVYEQELRDEILIHNLEHGGIGLHYNCPEGCPELVAQLLTIPPTGFSQYIVSPYSNMDHRIAVTAYRHLMYLEEFDEARIQEFVDAYLDRAPESVPGNLF